MKTRPILFNAESIRAILNDRKSQTRRVIKSQPIAPESHTNGWYDVTRGKLLKCPYGVPGDRLWVRETWATTNVYDGIKPSQIPRGCVSWPRVWYKTDFHQKEYKDMFFGRWRPSIHMPRWASRILLEIVDVQIERIQEITAENIIAEGIEDKWQQASCTCLFLAWRKLWDSINAKCDYGWDVNPWVWVVEFRILEAKR